MRSLTVGLIKGQNEIPNSVERYIFEEGIKDIFDYESIRNHIRRFIKNEVEVYFRIVRDDDDSILEYSYSGKRSLTVYVTGFKPIVCELVDLCNKYGVFLTLVHYNRDTGTWYPQFLGDVKTVKNLVDAKW